MMEKIIPSFSLTRQNVQLMNDFQESFNKVVQSGIFINGENVKCIERDIASFCDVNFGVGVASGSDALYLSLLACDIGPGTEVITTPFTFFATASSIERAGAKTVFVDIDPDTWNINTDLIEKKITSHTRAIIPVHLYGCPADMDPVMLVARRHGLRVIEDSAQSIGALYKGKKVSSVGDVGCISFFPTKNLGAFGDGGMVLTNDPEIAERVRILRVHGAKPKYYHQILGCNSRLDEMQAAILRVKLKHLGTWISRRKETAELYHKLLEGLTDFSRERVKLPVTPYYASHVYHQYTIQTKYRDELKSYLKQHGVETAVYYPLPLHLQKVFSHLGYREGDLPVAEAACREVLSLPMFPELAYEEACHVGEIISKFFSGKEPLF